MDSGAQAGMSRLPILFRFVFLKITQVLGKVIATLNLLEEIIVLSFSQK